MASVEGTCPSGRGGKGSLGGEDGGCCGKRLYFDILGGDLRRRVNCVGKTVHAELRTEPAERSKQLPHRYSGAHAWVNREKQMDGNE